MDKRKLVLIILVVLVSFQTACNDENNDSTVNSISQAELRDHVFFLASDALEGRVLGTPGYEIAAKYAASQLLNAGLKPMFKDADGSDSFYQVVPITKVSSEVKSNLIITTPQAEYEFPNKDNILWRRHNNFEVFADNLTIVFAGYGIEEPDKDWNDFQDIDISGKIVFIIMGAPLNNGKPVLPEEIHNKYSELSGASYKIGKLLKRAAKPAALLIIGDQEVLSEWDNISSLLDHSSYDLASGETQPSPSEKFDVLLAKPVIGDSMLSGQRYNPMQYENVNLQNYQTYELEGARFYLDVSETREEIITWNIIGVVPGTDPALKAEYISVGAHLDHIPPQDGQICNGADDNASGSAGVFEIAEAVAMNPQRRPVIFALWGGEDIGSQTLGSRYFVNHPPVELEKIKVNVNLDMLGMTTPKEKERRTHFVFGFESTLPSFQVIIDRVNARTVQWPLSYGHDGGSDHSSFHRKGIPAFFFCSGVNPFTHTPGDDAEIMDYEKMAKISQLAYFVICEFANLGEFPVISD